MSVQASELLEVIFENTHILIAYLDKDLRFQRVNKAYAAADGKPPEYFTGKKHFDLYPHQENETIFKRVLETGEPYTCYAKPFEYQFNPERGVTHWDWSLVPIRNENNEVNGVILQLLNVTDRIEAEYKLAFQEKLSNAFVESTTALMVAVNNDGKIVLFNKACENITHYQASEILNRYFWEQLLVPEEIESVKAVFQDLKNTNLPNEHVNYWCDKEGNRHLIHWSNSVVKDENNVLQYVVSVGIDITQLMAAQDELRRSEEKLLEAQAAAKIGTWDWEIKQNKLYWSDEVFKIFDVSNTPGERIFTNTFESFIEHVYRDDQEIVRQAVQASLKDINKPYHVSHRVSTLDGEIRHVEETGKVDFEDGKPVRMLGVVQDVTQRYLQEREINQFKYTLDQTLDCVYMFDAESLHFTYVNEGAKNQVGYSAKELLSLHPYDINPEYSRKTFQRKIKPLLEDQLPALSFETIHQNKQGQRIPVEIFLQYIQMEEAPAKFIAIVRDISEQKKAFQLLQTQSRIIDQIHDSVISTDLEGFITSWNKGAEKMFGYSADEVLRKHISFVYPREEHDFLQNNVILPLRQEGEYEIESRMIRESGEEFWGHLSLSMLYDEDHSAMGMIGYTMDITDRKKAEAELKESEYLLEQAQRIAKVGHWKLRPSIDEFQVSEQLIRIFELNSGKVSLEQLLNVMSVEDKNETYHLVERSVKFGESWSKEVKLILASGNKKWIQASCEIIKDEVGSVIELVGVVQDITEIKHYRMRLEDLVEERTAEMKAAKDEAERANRAKSEFLSRMSHELRTPLNAILGFVQLLSIDKRFALTEMQKDSVNEIELASRHLLHLVNDILDLSGIESGYLQLNIQDVEINPLVGTCIKQVKSLAMEKKVTLNLESESHYHVRADQTRLKQVMLNLLSNAIKYNREGGSVNVKHEQQNGCLTITVQDTGVGIPEQELARLFKPFERLDSTSSTVEGTGIGLALAKKLVESMHGKIGVESTLGKGSNFWFEIPLSEANDSVDSRIDTETAAFHNPSFVAQKRVLYIEDNAANLRLIKKIISMREDLLLMTAGTAEEGLALVKEHRPDLVLLDLNLPGMNGFEALQILKADEQTENIPVFAISANAMQHDIDYGKSVGFDEYLTKPINLAEFFAKIDQYLLPHPIAR